MRYYYVYILQCSDGSYYTGMTNNIERRFSEHQNGENKGCFTYNRRPLKLKFCEEYSDVNQAIKFENQIKGWTIKKKEAIIENNWEKLREYSICQNDTHFKNEITH